ncbi:alpha/beta hydrolase family protein [Glaciecola petra]|uniref:Prolyl oligopeptidase family serine peptidase n=1 Tax=Glaciecola petra TaxID=3075602 RepID=A0ABU2ZQ34_9ALTE|nr:alpha/beta fold hydrolase [Aestuariibacter sp. P117]MDT0594531.1 prolyl oligopeptidase family serine peptidase [Aestuariibacter sp. P117]
MKKILLLCLMVFSLPSFADNLASILFGERETSNIRLSPNGKHYAIARMSDTITEISVYDSYSQEIKNTIDIAEVFDKDTLLRGMQWIDNQYIATILIDKSDIETALLERNMSTRLIIVDVKSKTEKALIYQVSTSGYLVEPAPQEAGVFYFSRNNRTSKVYRIEVQKLLKVGQKRNKLTRVDGGQFVAKNVIATADGYVMEWFFNEAAKPSAVLLYNKDMGMDLAVYQYESDPESTDKPETKGKELTPVTIKTWPASFFEDEKDKESPNLLPMAKAKDENSFYAMDINEEQAISLYLADFKTGEHTQIYTSPGLPIKDLIYGNDEQAIGVIVVEQGLYTELYFGDDTTDIANKNQQAKLNIVSSENEDASVRLLYKESHNEVGQYYIAIGDKTETPVLSRFPSITSPLPSKQVMDSVTVDELDIPYLLTLPEGATQTPAPLVLLPHGGPINIYDSPYFDSSAQFFAARGYAVLRVNFRGSGGNGIDFRDAGKKQWGDKMLVDLTAALKKVSSRDDIDARRTCTVGMSYGGYASAALVLKHPELFVCAASVSGVLDMNLFLKNPNISKAQQKWLSEYVGDPLTDYEQLLEISPLYQLHSLSRPLLLVHGVEDRRVNVEHAYRAKLLLEKAQIPFEFSIFEDAGHHFSEGDQSVRMFLELLAFLDKHLKPTKT